MNVVVHDVDEEKVIVIVDPGAALPDVGDGDCVVAQPADEFVKEFTV